MSETHRPALRDASLIVLVGAAGCGPTASVVATTAAEAEAGTPTRVISRKVIRPGEVPHPGKVLVDHDARRIELRSGGDALCRIWEMDVRKRAIPPLVEVRAPSGYGIDRRFARPRDDMMRLGAACLKNEGAPCRTIVDTMLAWSNADAAIVRTSGDDSPFWNDSITVNLEVVRPFVGAYAIARASVAVAPNEDALIRQWVEKVLARSRHLMRGLHRKGRNYAAHNHAVASAAALMAYGAMWGDAQAFGHGIDQWFITLGDMRSDGSFPIEARRGARALFYTGRTLSGLMSIAEMARAQGIDLYAMAPTEKKTIHRAVAFMLAAMDRDEVIYRYARENYDPGPSDEWRRQDLGSPGTTMAWAVPYAARFPDHPNSSTIQSLRRDPESDHGVVFNHVLDASIPEVMGHWIGARADCLYRAS